VLRLPLLTHQYLLQKSVCGRAAIPKISTIIITIIDRFIRWFDGYIKLNKDMGKIIIVIQRNTEISE
jgi:hypothetical protein